MTPTADFLLELERTLRSRISAPAQTSYVASLNAKGVDAILKKIGEEAAEVLIAAKNPSRQALVSELADLWFHCQVLLATQDIPLSEVIDELARRHGRSGLDEKASRSS